MDTVATYPVLRAVRPAVASVRILASIQGVPEIVDSHAYNARNRAIGLASTIVAESCAMSCVIGNLAMSHVQSCYRANTHALVSVVKLAPLSAGCAIMTR